MSTQNEVGPKGQLVMGIVFVIGSLVVIGIAVSAMLGSSREREAITWPQVQGVVMASGSERFRDNVTHGRNWVPYVQYSYHVDGNDYSGDTYRFFPATYEGLFKNEAEKRGEQYRPGGGLQVRVNPDDPSDSVIVALPARGKGSSYIAIGVSCLGLLIGLALARGGLKGMRAGA